MVTLEQLLAARQKELGELAGMADKVRPLCPRRRIGLGAVCSPLD